MEARAAFRRPTISKMVWAIVALAAACLLGATAAYILKTATTAAPAAAATHFVQGFGPSDTGSAWNYSMQRRGTQSVEGPAPTEGPLLPVRARSSGNQIYP